MKIIKLFTSSVAVFMFPLLVSAQGFNKGLAGGQQGTPLETLLLAIIAFTENVLIPFVFAIGFLMFVWGIFLFFIAGGSNEESKEKGKSLMVYAILGFVVIIIFWGIINLLAQTTGLEADTITTPVLPKAGPGAGGGAI